MKTKVKTCPVQIKAAGAENGLDEGEFEALVSVFGNADAVGDIVFKGAFKNTLEKWGKSGDPIPVIWSHQHDDPESHIGYVVEAKETDDGLWVKGKVDMEEPRARKVYKLLKGRRVTKFSFAYDIKDPDLSKIEDFDDIPWNDTGGFDLKELDLFEVGPTLIPANAETDLLAVKERRDRDAELKSLFNKAAVGTHSTATSDATWDGPANEAKLNAPMSLATVKAAYAWYDAGETDENGQYTKSACKFIHHEVGSDGTPGAANLTACSTGIGILNGGRGGTNIPDADVQGVYNHLAAHLRAADQEPPELASRAAVAKAGEFDAQKLVEYVFGKAGRVLSAKNQKTLEDAVADITAALGRIKSVLSAVESGSEDEAAKAAEPVAGDDKAHAEDLKQQPVSQDEALRLDDAMLVAAVDLLRDEIEL